MSGLNKVRQGHVLDKLKELPDESVDCVFTSPPYWSLRCYQTEPQIWRGSKECSHEWGNDFVKKQSGGVGKTDVGNYSDDRIHFEVNSQFCKLCNGWKGELGLEPDFGLYLEHLLMVFDEVKRVLKSSGTCFINLGDTYAGSGNGTNDYRTEESKSLSGKRFDYNMMFQGKQQRQFQKLPGKCLAMIPYRFAVAMTERGWTLRNVIIWHKRNCMPSSVKDRFTVDFEPIFFFSKSRKYYFDLPRESSITGNGSSMGIASGKRFNQNVSGFGERELRNNPAGRAMRTMWDITTEPFKEAHFATFPTKLAERVISAGCPESGVALDPFCGAGTVGIAARKLSRNFIGIELKPEYVEMAEKRIASYLERKQLSEVIRPIPPIAKATGILETFI